MQKLVECVPNFSEGRDRGVLDAISAAITGVQGVQLLDVDPGADTNRTVVTFVGSPDAALEAAFRAIECASHRIDMSRHHGAHPRMGATDVCPFVPLEGMTMEECVDLARRLGARVGEELGIPVYLYERAATRPERTSLAAIRTGEYEGLQAKLGDPEWAPDFGSATFHARAGATVIGAREFLIAYNVNLNTRDRKLANEVAFTVRESGRLAKDAEGRQLVDSEGNKVRQPGRLRAARAVGWYIPEYGRAQISINLLDMNVTPPHLAFEVCDEEARKLGLRVTGSELVGLIPKSALLQAGRYYLERQGKSSGVPERELVHTAVRSLGLDELGPFDADHKVIEYRVADRKASLVERTTRDFVDELSSDSPAPGGGSVAALAGALGAALGAMVANLTIGKRGLEEHWSAMRPVAHEGQALKDWFLAAVDEDTRAFNRVMESMRLPQSTDEERAARAQAVEEANRGATLVPLRVLERSIEVVELAAAAVAEGNPNSLSDAGVAVLCARTAAEGAWLNVAINLANLVDREWAEEARKTASGALVRTRIRAGEVLGQVEARLNAR